MGTIFEPIRDIPVCAGSVRAQFRFEFALRPLKMTQADYRMGRILPLGPLSLAGSEQPGLEECLQVSFE